jgi:hypothetical protein
LPACVEVQEIELFVGHGVVEGAMHTGSTNHNTKEIDRKHGFANEKDIYSRR